MAGLCDCRRDAEGGRKDQRDGAWFDRNRLNPCCEVADLLGPGPHWACGPDWVALAAGETPGPAVVDPWGALSSIPPASRGGRPAIDVAAQTSETIQGPTRIPGTAPALDRCRAEPIGSDAARVHRLVVELLQLGLVLGLFIRQEDEQLLDGAVLGALGQ